MTVSELIHNHKGKHPMSLFFEPSIPSGYWDTMSDMQVEGSTQRILGSDGEEHECYVLDTYKRERLSGWLKSEQFYFDCETFEMIMPYERMQAIKGIFCREARG